MVLDKLGDSLKGALSKLTGASFVDEKLINEIVKDIQRALLQADVNVKLVFELTKNIKERAKERTPPGLTKKEQLVNILYEELASFLGGEHVPLKTDHKPTVIMLVGLFGNGKCVHKDSEVLLATGESVRAKDLYDRYADHQEETDDGYVVELSEPLLVPSFNPHTLKIEHREASHLWKLRKDALVDVRLDNGNDAAIKTTPEHPFFVWNGHEVLKKTAQDLKKGDLVAVPRKTSFTTHQPLLINHLRSLDAFAAVDVLTAINIKQRLVTEHGTLQKAAQALGVPNYASFTHQLKKGIVPIQLAPETAQHIRLRGTQQSITLPQHVTPELAEFIGYIVGDGYLSSSSVHLSTASEQVLERFSHLAQSLFGLKTTITADNRSKALHLRVHSRTLTTVLSVLCEMPFGKKGRNLRVPKIVQSASTKARKAFLRAYIDCDGHMTPHRRCIEVTSESKQLLQQVKHLLLEQGIVCTQEEKSIHAKSYARISIQARYATQYAETIGSLIPYKQKMLSSYKRISATQGDGKQDMLFVPLLRELRLRSGHSLGQVQHTVSSYGLYEQKQRISRTQLQKLLDYYGPKYPGKYAQFIDYLSHDVIARNPESIGLNQPNINALRAEFLRQGLIDEEDVLSSSGQQLLASVQHSPKEIVSLLDRLATSDVCWIPVASTAMIENDDEWVYDLSVPYTHSFIANGIVVHNTTSAGKLAKYYQTRGKKVALISTDTWRPAAYEQLRQLGAQIDVPVFGDPKADNPAEIYKAFYPEMKDFDIIICDTAGRDALSEELVSEITEIDKAVDAHHKLLVIAADMGQSAQAQAQMFHDTVGVTGVIITKLDGTAKGGGALSACAVTGAQVQFIGVGEKIDALEEFKPKNFVGRLLGMGDLEALLEKAKLAMTEEQAQDISKKLLKGDFTLLDLHEQMAAMRKMGPLNRMLEMIPGMSSAQIPKEALAAQEESLERWKHIMHSMTKHELEEADKINNSRIQRISEGSGQPEKEVRAMIKQYKQSKKLMRMMKGKGSEKKMKKMMQRMGGPQLKF